MISRDETDKDGLVPESTDEAEGFRSHLGVLHDLKTPLTQTTCRYSKTIEGRLLMDGKLLQQRCLHDTGHVAPFGVDTMQKIMQLNFWQALIKNLLQKLPNVFSQTHSSLLCLGINTKVVKSIWRGISPVSHTCWQSLTNSRKWSPTPLNSPLSIPRNHSLRSSALILEAPPVRPLPELLVTHQNWSALRL